MGGCTASPAYPADRGAVQSPAGCPKPRPRYPAMHREGRAFKTSVVKGPSSDRVCVCSRSHPAGRLFSTRLHARTTNAFAVIGCFEVEVLHRGSTPARWCTSSYSDFHGATSIPYRCRTPSFRRAPTGVANESNEGLCHQCRVGVWSQCLRKQSQRPVAPRRWLGRHGRRNSRFIVRRRFITNRRWLSRGRFVFPVRNAHHV
jgi:hypothetical protein